MNNYDAEHEKVCAGESEPNKNDCEPVYDDSVYCCLAKCSKQRHVHEILGSTVFSELKSEPHNHRFATVSGEAIPLYDNCSLKDHVHKVSFGTDFHKNHYHEFSGTTGPAIDVGGGRHVHYLESITSKNNSHKHFFRTASAIENPTESEKCKKQSCNC